MTLVGSIVMTLVSLALRIAVQTWLFRVVSRGIGRVAIGWGAALLTVAIAGLAQSTVTSVLAALGFIGAGDVCGTLIGFFVWSATAAALTLLTLRQAIGVAVVMAIAWWLMRTIVLLVFVALGGAVILGLAGLVFL